MDRLKQYYLYFLFTGLFIVMALGGYARFSAGSRFQQSASAPSAPREGDFELHSFPSGKKKCEGALVKGVRQGLWRCWYENSRLENEINYLDGKKNGEVKFWTSDGFPDFVSHWENGALEGESSYWFEGTNQLRLQGHYHEGRLQGTLREWFASGKISLKSEYKNNMMDGISQEWLEDGSKFSLANYYMNMKNGLYQEWYRTGQIHIESTYVRDKLEGVYREWQENGKPKILSHYNFGELDGTAIEYGKSGEIQSTVEYQQGKRVSGSGKADAEREPADATLSSGARK